MTARCAPESRQGPLYFIEVCYGRRLGNAFEQLDRDSNSRAEAIRQVRAGNVIKVLEIDEANHTVRDVTDELRYEASQDRKPASLEASYERLLALQDHNRKLRAEA